MKLKHTVRVTVAHDGEGTRAVEYTYHDMLLNEKLLGNGVMAAYTYEYDSAYQLTNWERGVLTLTDTMVHSPAYSQQWTHDSRGNWEQFNDNGTIQTRTHSRTNKLVDIDGASITYDANGNMLNSGSNTYTWNAKGLLVTANTVNFQYDALSRRVGKDTERYIIDGWSTIAEVASDGTRKNIIYGGYIDELVSVITAVDTFYAADNHLASVTNIYNKDGAKVEGYRYTPFGGMSLFDADGNEITASLIGNVRSFTGREWEGELGINYYRARYYDPGLGRFLSEDPIGFEAGDINFYRYVSNSPTDYVDPYGLFELSGKSNCLGYALTGSGSIYIEPFNQSMLDLTKEYGWNCKEVGSASSCKCECNQKKVYIVVYKVNQKKNKGKDVFKDKDIRWGDGTDFHAMRAENGCSRNYLNVLGAFDETPQKPTSAAPNAQAIKKGRKLCCCQ